MKFNLLVSLITSGELVCFYLVTLTHPWARPLATFVLLVSAAPTPEAEAISLDAGNVSE